MNNNVCYSFDYSKESSITLVPSPAGNELMDLQVDYWLAAGNKKEVTKVRYKKMVFLLSML